MKYFRLSLIIYLMFFSVYSYVTPQEVNVSDSSKQKSDTVQTVTNDKDKKKVTRPRILVIGHSWAYGAFHNDSLYFSEYGINIDEITKIGSSVQWAIDTLKNVPEKNYDAICIFTGVNDYKNEVNYIADKFYELFQEGFNKAPVLFVFNIPDWKPASEKIKVLNQWLDDMAKLNDGLIIFDIYNEMELQKQNGFQMRADGLHPSNYDVVRNFFIYFVQKYYNIK